MIPLLRHAWQRCLARGQAVDQPLTGQAALEAHQQQLLALARSSIEDLYQLIERPGFAVLLADASACVVELAGDPVLLELALQCGVRPLVQLEEMVAGTNAVDLALREAQPLWTVGEEHYHLHLRPLALAAAPFFRAEGDPMGVIALLMAAPDAHPYALGMAIAAAQALQNQLRAEQLLAEANDQLAELYAVLEAMSEGVIFVGPNEEIRRINSHAAGLLGVSVRSVAGRPFVLVLNPPPLVYQALQEGSELVEQEVLWPVRKGLNGLVCALRPVHDYSGRYLGALVTLRPTQSLHRLVHRVVGAEARFTFRDIIGQSPAMLATLHQAHLAANGSGSILLRGEAGVGKEVLAQAIHNASARADGPFVGVNCAAVPRPLLAGELFGVEGDPLDVRHQGRPGKIELAQGGVLYLEDVDALPMELQTGLLRAIEMRRMMRSGSVRVVPIDVRIIATAGSDLERHVYEGRFRADLLARLSTLEVVIPPLRERGDDLLLLVTHLLGLLGERLGRQVALAPEALHALQVYPWPGNVRELELVLERALSSSEKSVLTLEDLPPSIARGAVPLDGPPIARLDEHNRFTERDAILRAGRQASGHLGRTAALLGISRATLWRKMTRYGLARDDFWTGFVK